LPHFPILPSCGRRKLTRSIASVIATAVCRLLESELARRRARNPRYSLRAFAGRLRIDHSTLSQWMRGRRTLTPRGLAQIRRLDLHDFAILDLVRRHDFRPDSRWIAAQLRVGVDETNVALQRLLRLNLLTMDAADRWSTPLEEP
jgi:DNA-binding transcriptional regulator YdaS (Cro superfamily)